MSRWRRVAVAYLAAWCSWLSRSLHMRKVSSSNLDAAILFFLFLQPCIYNQVQTNVANGGTQPNTLQVQLYVGRPTQPPSCLDRRLSSLTIETVSHWDSRCVPARARARVRTVHTRETGDADGVCGEQRHAGYHASLILTKPRCVEAELRSC